MTTPDLGHFSDFSTIILLVTQPTNDLKKFSQGDPSNNLKTNFSLQELRNLATEHKNVHILQIDLKDFDKYPEIVGQVEGVVKDAGLNVLFNSAGIR